MHRETADLWHLLTRRLLSAPPAPNTNPQVRSGAPLVPERRAGAAGGGGTPRTPHRTQPPDPPRTPHPSHRERAPHQALAHRVLVNGRGDPARGTATGDGNGDSRTERSPCPTGSAGARSCGARTGRRPRRHARPAPGRTAARPVRPPAAPDRRGAGVRPGRRWATRRHRPWCPGAFRYIAPAVRGWGFGVAGHDRAHIFGTGVRAPGGARAVPR